MPSVGNVSSPVGVNPCEDSACCDGPIGMSFSDALIELKDGAAISRHGWHKAGMYLKIQTPDYYSKMTEPYVYIVIPKNGVVSINEHSHPRADGATRLPWLASQADLLSHDWFLVSPK